MNQYNYPEREIDVVYNVRTGKKLTAKEVFHKFTAEEISVLRMGLEEAVRRNEPYLICPSCRQMIKISSRKYGYGTEMREMQFFTHAVRNVFCDLKKQYRNDVDVDGDESEEFVDSEYVVEFKEKLNAALSSIKGKEAGIESVHMNMKVFSKELSVMKYKARTVDFLIKYKGLDLVLELVDSTTNLKKVQDLDIYFTLNDIKVLWVFGLNSLFDYNELKRSVAKDILFTNKRNVFVFDIEAQNKTNQEHELYLKCNWLDKNNEWYYQNDKNGANGKLIKLSDLKYEVDNCRPYYYDADIEYYELHPNTDRPYRYDKEILRKEIEELSKSELLYNKKETADTIEVIDDNIRKMNGNEKIVSSSVDGAIMEGQRYKSEIKLSNKYYIVESFDGFWGLLNTQKKIVVYPKYSFIEKIDDQYLKICENAKWGLMDSEGKIICNPQFKTIESFDGKYFYVTIADKNHILKGRIDCTGNNLKIIPDVVLELFDGFKKIKQAGKWGMIDPLGKQIVNCKYDELTTFR